VKVGLLVTAALAVVYGLHRLGLWAERRGWIRYRLKRGSSGTLSSAFLEVHSLVEPSRRHVLEHVRRDTMESYESGEPPSPKPPAREGDEGGST
jgi:hypothetical protein